MYYLIYFILLFALINLCFLIASRYNIVDHPVDRSSHNRPVLKGGGIIIPLGIVLWFIWSGFQDPWFFTGLMLVSFVSFLEDISHVKRGIRFLSQLAAILLLTMQFDLPPLLWWVWVLMFFTAIAIINAFNFMDGINGITAGYSLSALAGLWIVNNYQAPFISNDLLYASGLAVALFSFYNFRNHARCFAGDVGPVAISFILVFLLGKLILTSGNIAYLMFLIIYGVDTFLTIVKRMMRHENIIEPHRQHLYQLLANESGISHVKVSTAYTLAQLVINLLIIALAGQVALAYQMLVAIGITLVLATVYVIVKGNLRTVTRVAP